MLSNSICALPALCQETLAQYISKVMSIPDLSREEELHYAKMYTEEHDVDAAHRLIFSHLKYVVKISRGFLGYGLQMSELIAEGNTGLLKAVKNFKYTMGFRFVTYASWWIKAHLREYVFRFHSFVSISNTKSARKLFFGFRKLKQKILRSDDRALTGEEISFVAKKMGVDEKDVIAMEKYFMNKELSLNSTPSQKNEIELQDALPSSDEYELYSSNNEYEERMLLIKIAIQSLPAHLADIIERRHLTDKPETLDVLSKKYSLSKERIRQLETQAIEKIKNFIRSKGCV